VLFLEDYDKNIRNLTVFEGKNRFIEAGFPVNKYRLARTEEEAVKFAKEIGFPVVLKIVSPKILHKTDVEGIILNLKDDEEVSQAFNKLMKIMRKHDPSCMESEKTGIMVEEMVEDGAETIIGGFTDESYGKVIIFGLGGIFVEILQDVSFRLAPIEEYDAWEMVKGIKGSKILLEGYRGKGTYDFEKLIDIIVKVSKFFHKREEILEFDLNPIFVLPKGKGVKIVDVRVILKSD
jgi:acyl-CoA synthetase (NDP forming)